MKVQDSSPIPGMDEGIDELGHVTIFLTMDANSKYWKEEIFEENRVKPPLRVLIHSFAHLRALRIEECPCEISTRNGRPIDESQTAISQCMFRRCIHIFTYVSRPY